MADLFLGADPGVNGGWGIVDAQSRLVSCGHRISWKDIEAFKDQILCAGIERIQVRHETTKQHTFRLQPLIENYGFWVGLCSAWAIPFEIIHPRTWKSFYRLEVSGGAGLSPQLKRELAKTKQEMMLSLSRRLWPGAPLKFKKNDGIAAGLLIADYLRGQKAGWSVGS